ncbi:uncharacterized protein LOC114517824 [Dendronephthya gigantea]|uniref:uncharacterized protein LOC114517824 n=1 Tax=Dendronephthya gigantea TaxID=151771 RepID=UPI00106C5FF6|nr:uncharacterized protein LOC114517824 [Dendronephthya gigantea]
MLYLFQAILESIFALIFFTLNICYINDLKETMKCTVAQHIPVPHDYFICSHSLAPAFRLGVYIYSSVLGLCLLTYIYITGWTVVKVRKNKCEYNFKKEKLPALVGEKLSDMNSVNGDFGFLLHLLHSYSKLYVVRLAHYLSKSNKKKTLAEFLNNKYHVSKLKRLLRKNEKKITFNRLRGIPQTIFQLGTEIVTLELKQCELEIEDFDNFYQLTSLRKLSVIECGLQCIPDGILMMDWLEELNLKGNSITLIDERVLSLKYLTSLDLSKNKIKTIKAGSLEQLKNLFTVDVTGNSGLGIPGLKVILACERLCILRCSNKLSDKRNDLNKTEREKFDAVTSAKIESFVIPYTPEKAPHIDVQNTQKNYKMNSQPKGVAIIINIRSFSKDIYPYRRGSEKDVVKLKALFENIGFDTVCNPIDYTAEEAKKFLKECAKERKYESCDCIVVAVMTHGNDVGLIFHDGEEVPVPEIVDCVQMSSLYDGKPKLFFLQCCRGQKKARGRTTFSNVPVKTSTDRDLTHSTELHAGVTATDSVPAYSEKSETDASPTPHVMFEADIPNGADVLLSYSTMPGYASFRNVSKGSWYVQVLVETFSQHAFEEDVLSLLTLVNYEVARAYTSAKWRQVPCPQSTLTRKLYLLPGYPKPKQIKSDQRNTYV